MRSKNYFYHLFNQYKSVFTSDKRRSLYTALFLLILSMFFQYYSSNYSTAHSTQFVGDIFLDNMPTINMNPIIVEGALISLALGILLVLSKPRYIIFTIKTFAIFVTLRSFFVAATHLGIYPDQIVPSKGFFDQIYLALNLESGYFFSAHTGLPFLMGLIFVKDPFWRNIFFAMSCLFGVSVLLAHVHYSIDVFAAPFMTYSVYKMSVYLFKEDYKLIESE